MSRVPQVWLGLLQGGFSNRVAALWLLWGGALAFTMVSLGLRRHGLRGLLRRCALDFWHDWSSLVGRRLDHDFDYAQRWVIWYVVLASTNVLIGALSSAAYGDRDPSSILIWLATLIFVLALFSPFAMYVDARVEAGQLNHIAEGHPMLARLFRYKSPGSIAISPSHRRRCRRLFCILRG